MNRFFRYVFRPRFLVVTILVLAACIALLTLSKTAVPGTISDVVRSNRGELKRCYEDTETLERSPPSNIRIWFEVRPDGTVARTGASHLFIARAAETNAAVDACVESVIHQWVFVPPGGNGVLASFTIFSSSQMEGVLMLDPHISSTAAPPIGGGVSNTIADRLARSTSLLPIAEAVPLVITKNGVLLNNQLVVRLMDDGRIDPSALGSSMTISPLVAALRNEADHQKMYSRYNPAAKFEGLLLIIGSDQAKFETLTQILYSAGQAEFGGYFMPKNEYDALPPPPQNEPAATMPSGESIQDMFRTLTLDPAGKGGAHSSPSPAFGGNSGGKSENTKTNSQ